MLFNCLNCCKAISSKAESCPYCMLGTSSMVREVQPAQPSQIPRLAFFMKRSAYRARKTAESIGEKLPQSMPKKMPHITHIVQGMKIANQ